MLATTLACRDNLAVLLALERNISFSSNDTLDNRVEYVIGSVIDSMQNLVLEPLKYSLLVLLLLPHGRIWYVHVLEWLYVTAPCCPSIACMFGLWASISDLT